MEYVHSVCMESILKFVHWRRIYKAPKMLCLVNQKEFEKKLKMKPLRVCPLFPGLEDIEECDVSIAAIHEKFQISPSRRYSANYIAVIYKSVVLDINDRDDVAREFKAFEQLFGNL